MRILESFLSLLFVFVLNETIQSQIIEETGYIFTKIASNISAMPSDSGNHYSEPSTEQLNTWENILDNLILNNYDLASDSANNIRYQLIEFTDTFEQANFTYYILESIDTNYWGTYVFNPNYCRALVIQSPHAKNDANTGHQGIHTFRETEAMFYQVNGTHRCNSAGFSVCSGTTATCSSTSTSEAYRISDLAHTTQSFFQKTTEVLFHSFDDTYFIQLHGFSKLSTDPYVILSNGTQETPTLDYMTSFKDFLYDEDNLLSFKIAHIDTNWTRLRGFWNTQSRYINESTDACNDNATITEGRFFHIEQERLRLRNDITGWTKISNALTNTFECKQDTVIEPNSLNTNSIQENIFVYPNPTTKFVTIDWKLIHFKNYDYSFYNLQGQNLTKYTKVLSHENHETVIDLNLFPNGIYILKVSHSVFKLTKE